MKLFSTFINLYRYYKKWAYNFSYIIHVLHKLNWNKNNKIVEDWTKKLILSTFFITDCLPLSIFSCENNLFQPRTLKRKIHKYFCPWSYSISRIIYVFENENNNFKCTRIIGCNLKIDLYIFVLRTVLFLGYLFKMKHVPIIQYTSLFYYLKN